MRALRSVLTTRGRAFMGSGITLALAGMIFGFPDLTRFGVLLIAPADHLGHPRAHPQDAHAHRAAHPSRAHQRRPGRLRDALVRERLVGHDPDLPRRGAARLRARRPAALRRRPHPARPGARHRLPGALAPARPAPPRPARGAGAGPLRPRQPQRRARGHDRPRRPAGRPPALLEPPPERRRRLRGRAGAPHRPARRGRHHHPRVSRRRRPAPHPLARDRPHR